MASAGGGGAAAGGFGGGGRNAARPTGQNTTPMATQLKLSGWDPDHTGTPYGVVPGTAAADSGSAGGRGGRGGGGGGGRGGFGGGNNTPQSVPGLTADPNAKTRVVIQF